MDRTIHRRTSRAPTACVGGGARTVKDEWLQYVVTGLASGVPYEFRFAAVNEEGTGPWSEPSPPIACSQLGQNVPLHRVR